MFFAAALSIDFIVVFNNVVADSSFDVIASLHFFIAVLRADFLIVFFNVFAFAIFTLLIADFMFGKLFTSCDLNCFINIRYSNTNYIKMQGK